ncbi:MAG: hypothetical protein JST47_14895 [Bacteroidetes bacterium]|nr:hypothetical protein [Bacteroidota bacterium]MBS1974376.1 hypothetical protein [Bacteroidota bacterium]
MRKLILLLAIFMFSSCEKKPSPAETSKHLISAMSKYLASENDTNKFKFQVLGVEYFEDSAFYECDFTIKMRAIKAGKDTVGIMRARISKNYEAVKRRS